LLLLRKYIFYVLCIFLHKINIFWKKKEIIGDNSTNLTYVFFVFSQTWSQQGRDKKLTPFWCYPGKIYSISISLKKIKISIKITLEKIKKFFLIKSKKTKIKNKKKQKNKKWSQFFVTSLLTPGLIENKKN